MSDLVCGRLSIIKWGSPPCHMGCLYAKIELYYYSPCGYWLCAYHCHRDMQMFQILVQGAYIMDIHSGNKAIVALIVVMQLNNKTLTNPYSP